MLRLLRVFFFPPPHSVVIRNNPFFLGRVFTSELQGQTAVFAGLTRSVVTPQTVCTSCREAPVAAHKAPPSRSSRRCCHVFIKATTAWVSLKRNPSCASTPIHLDMLTLSTFCLEEVLPLKTISCCRCSHRFIPKGHEKCTKRPRAWWGELSWKNWCRLNI